MNNKLCSCRNEHEQLPCLVIFMLYRISNIPVLDHQVLRLSFAKHNDEQCVRVSFKNICRQLFAIGFVKEFIPDI